MLDRQRRYGTCSTKRRFGSAGAAIALVGALLPLGVVGAGPASATSDPAHVTFTLEGCRNNGGIVLPDGGGNFICPDAAYTTGNLGKGWNELDLVPHRLTASLGTQTAATTTYAVAVTADNLEGGVPGYDVLSAPVLNAGKSHASCSVSDAGQQTLSPGVGGTDTSIYRLLTISQNKGTTCVFDYYERLALGSHEYPGSSLHSNLLNQAFGTAGVGARDVSIPVKEILPQELRKDMTATQGADHVWNITKAATPATLTFADTCDTSASSQSKAVSVKVEWTRLAASPSGDITVVTNIYAKNPASRTITVDVTDRIRSGTTVLDTASVSGVDVPANTEIKVLTHQTTVPAGTTNLNDVATATYTDKVTGIVVPGTTEATASATVQQTGPTLNQTATITDVESITGTGLSFSVDSFSGASGAFDGGYVAGTKTTGPVSWTSASQSGSGSVTFSKTVYVTSATVTSGTLSDKATLTGSDGFTAEANASTSISADAKTSLKVSKTTSLKLAGAQTFTFRLWNAPKPGSATGTSTTVTIPAGSNGPVTSAAIGGLSPSATYFFKEDALAPYPAQESSVVGFSLVAGDPSTCSKTVAFHNQAAPATARVRKITVPTGSTTWDFTLSGPGGLSETKTATAGAGYVSFDAALEVDGGLYTITETPKSGWDLTKVEGDFAGNAARVSTSVPSKTCSFTLDLTTDSGGVLSCTFTNTQRGTIIVKKVTDPAGASGSFTFTGDAAGSIGDGGSITVSDLQPGTYTSTEADPTPAFDLTKIECDDGASATPSTVSLADRKATFKLDAGETITCTFTNTQRGTVKVVKTVGGQVPTGTDAFTFQLRKDASTASNGTVLDTQVANAGNGGAITFSVDGTDQIKPGTYQLCEFIQVGWKSSIQTLAGAFVPGTGGDTEADNTYVCVPFTLAAGETKVFTIDNTRPPGGDAKTIGFWKNWASCAGSNGKQLPILDQTLVLSGGILIGDLLVDTCEEAVALLNKSTVDTDRKRASDPAFNLAAQLLAYRLNIVAGAGDCAAANAAATSAQGYLDGLNFNGTAAHGTINKSLAATLNGLEATLDSYNNNTLC